MRALVAAVALLGACAASSPPEPAAVAAAPAVEARELPPSPYVALAKRFDGIDLEGLTTSWPRRDALPKAVGCYAVAMSESNPAVCDGWCYDVLVDIEEPRIIWVRATGTIAGIIEYRGPAEVVGDSGPLEVRVAG